MDSLTKIGLEKFKNEVIPEIRRIIKETQSEAAEQGSKFEAMDAQNRSRQNFKKMSESAAKTDYTANVGVKDWVKELLGINNNELTANLFILQQKHPELFKKPSDVYKLLIEIKNNPTHFFKNNRPDMALVSKILQDGSVGKMAVVKNSGKVSHLSKSSKGTELRRLQNVNKRELGVGSPYPTLQRAENVSGRTDGDGAKAHSLADKPIIPQNSADRLVEKIIELDDAGEIGDMLQKTIISKDISTKTKLAVINAAKRRLVAIAANPTSTPDK